MKAFDVSSSRVEYGSVVGSDATCIGVLATCVSDFIFPSSSWAVVELGRRPFLLV
jgi:hypothetical protein